MGWSNSNEEAVADRYHDERKHDFPLHAEPKPMTTALEIAVLVKAIDLAMGADLIEQYAQCAAAGARVDEAEKARNRLNVALESPLSKEPIDG